MAVGDGSAPFVTLCVGSAPGVKVAGFPVFPLLQAVRAIKTHNSAINILTCFPFISFPLDLNYAFCAGCPAPLIYTLFAACCPFGAAFALTTAGKFSFLSASHNAYHCQHCYCQHDQACDNVRDVIYKQIDH